MVEFLSNFMRAKLLALSALVLTIASLACVLCALVPFWLEMKVDLTINDDKLTKERTINSGLFFMDETRFINIMMLDKAGNTPMAPPMIRLAQLFYLLGTLGVIVCCATCWILAVRKYASTTGEMCLAVATTPITLCLLISLVLVIMEVFVDTGSTWHGLPVPDYIPDRFGYYKSLDAVPTLSLNWGTYISCLAVFLTIVGCVIIWLQACCTCREYYDHRYTMIREEPDLGTSPMPGRYPAFSNVGYTKTTPGEVNI